MKVWKCSLCNVELLNDNLVQIRLERHRFFHRPVSYHRNIALGHAKFTLVRKNE